MLRNSLRSLTSPSPASATAEVAPPGSLTRSWRAQSRGRALSLSTNTGEPAVLAGERIPELLPISERTTEVITSLIARTPGGALNPALARVAERIQHSLSRGEPLRFLVPLRPLAGSELLTAAALNEPMNTLDLGQQIGRGFDLTNLRSTIALGRALPCSTRLTVVICDRLPGELPPTLQPIFERTITEAAAIAQAQGLVDRVVRLSERVSPLAWAGAIEAAADLRRWAPCSSTTIVESALELNIGALARAETPPGALLKLLTFQAAALSVERNLAEEERAIAAWPEERGHAFRPLILAHYDRGTYGAAVVVG